MIEWYLLGRYEWVVQKWLNQLRCHLKTHSGVDPKNYVLRVHINPHRGTFEEDDIKIQEFNMLSTMFRLIAADILNILSWKIFLPYVRILWPLYFFVMIESEGCLSAFECI